MSFIGKIRWWVILFFLILFTWRFAEWKREKGWVESWCASYSKTNPKSNQVVIFEGEPFYEVGEEGLSVRFHRPDWVSSGGRKAFPTRVVVRDLKGFRPESHRRIRVFGPVRCERKLRNPGRLQDGELAFFMPEVRLSSTRVKVESLSEGVGISCRASQWAREQIERQFRKFPSLGALVSAVWTGREEGLPEPLLSLYRDLGMLPVLALSGQHVLILTGLLTALLLGLLRLAFLSRFRWAVVWIGRGKGALPLLSTIVLYLASSGVPSMRRTAAMVLVVTILKIRGIYSSKIQTCLSTLGLMLLWNPHEMLSVGFLLSGIFTAFTIALAFDWGWRRFIYSSVVLPILGFPVTAFFFSKVALLTLLAQLTLGVIWELGWIPLGFLLPLFGAVLPSAWSDYLFQSIENLWSGFVALQLNWLSGLSTTAILVPRPTWWEWALLEALLLFAILRWVALRRE